MAGIGEACRAIFEKIDVLTDLKLRPSRPRSLVTSIEETRSRFQIWSDNIGACQARHFSTSLEHRIQGIPKLQELFKSSLEDLQEDLRDLECLLDDAQQDLLERVPFISTTIPISEDALGALPDTVADISQLLKAINEDVTSLFKLSIATRKIADRDHYTAAMIEVDTDEVGEEDIEAELIGNQFDRLRSPSLLWLRSRLAQANLSRKKFLAYCERHQAKTSVGTSRLAHVPALPTAIDSNMQCDSASVVAESTASTVLAAEPEKIQHEIDADEEDAELLGFNVTTSDTSSRFKPDVGDLDQVRKGEVTFICTYCKTEQTQRSQNAWRRHVLADIRAYVCTFKSCKLCLFQDSYAWLDHELSQHLAFQHYEPRGGRILDEDSEDFEDSEELEEYMITSHLSNLMHEQLPKPMPTILRQQDRIPSSACRFCDWQTKLRSGKRFIDPDRHPYAVIYVSPERYRRHVAAHLERVALNVITPPFSAGDVLIAVVGATGSGKSAFIQICTKDEIRIGQSLSSETERVSMHRCDFDLDRNVWLLDTPAFDNTKRNDTEVLKDIAGYLSKLYKSAVRLSGIIYMHRITDSGMQGAAKKNLSMMKKLLGPTAMAQLAFVSTFWRENEANTGARREQELREEHLQYEIVHGARMMRHDNTADSALAILQSFLDVDGPVVLDIQREMVDEGHSLRETSAGKHLNEGLEVLRKEYERRLGELLSHLEEAVLADDEDFQTLLGEEKDEITKRILELEDQRLTESDDVEATAPVFKFS